MLILNRLSVLGIDEFHYLPAAIIVFLLCSITP